MAIRVALHHRTDYRYARAVTLGPQLIRLRPAPHARTPVLSYSLNLFPEEHFLNWQQDPFGNFQARLVFPKPTKRFTIEVDLIADMTVINPFDFFVEPDAEAFPFEYEPWLKSELQPFMEVPPPDKLLRDFVESLPKSAGRTIDWLVQLNQALQKMVNYLVRMEPGVQSPEETLVKCSGSCRDSAWLLVHILRHCGLAARFVSGYLIQLKPDEKPLDGPAGATKDFTDLHAWTEVFLPGAGWIGLDPTSGLLTGEGHIPLAATPHPVGAAPITGGVDAVETEFGFDMTLNRVHEDPRVTKPYTEAQWQRIESLGHDLDRRLRDDDVRLTVGGEPTFVSIDDMDGSEWNHDAVGPHKRRLSAELMQRLRHRFAPGGLPHFGQGKWYPGESLPRWADAVFWRKDGKPIWHDPALIAETDEDYGFGLDEAKAFADHLAATIGVDDKYVVPAYEDAMYYAWKENRLPENVTAGDSKLKDIESRSRLARVFQQGLDTPRGFVMPLQQPWWQANGAKWATGFWPVRNDQMFLLPGDSPMGLRLPLDTLSYIPEGQMPQLITKDPTEAQPPLPEPILQRVREAVGVGSGIPNLGLDLPEEEWAFAPAPSDADDAADGSGSARASETPDRPTLQQRMDRLRLRRASLQPRLSPAEAPGPIFDTPPAIAEAPHVVRTALCIEPRQGRLHVFMPPVDAMEDYLDLIGAIELTALALEMPVMIEGYLPPFDARLNVLKVTPDPGVLEVNIHPANDWDESVAITTGLYEDARQTRLGSEKFDLDGTHTGTGGGNHVVLGAATPADSPFLRRPDLLGSMVTYWLNHPSLSYLFSGKFIGPTSQAPRMDEGRADSVYELELALKLIEDLPQSPPPWMVDRIFRDLLTDLTGNTHRAEVCIDKLYSPDSSTGRLGLVELRGFEMPPHPRMSLTQLLLIRALIAHFWRNPVKLQPVKWGTALHDRFMLPYFLWMDLGDVLDDLSRDGIELDPQWFAPHFEFRAPVLGGLSAKAIDLELRQALEPWHVLGEDPMAGGTTRPVDSSVERMQVLVTGLTGDRFAVACNGRKLPLHPTGKVGQAVAGVRYRAWQPPRCLHPTIPVHTPLTFDLVDTWQDRSLGGCTYHVSNPSGVNPDTFPVNAFEAESRRAARFFRLGHTPGTVRLTPEALNPQFPMTLDLRRPAEAR